MSGRIIEGMARGGFDVQLTRYAERGWRATLYPAGLQHSPTRAAGGLGVAATAWRAVQGEALQTLVRADVV